MFCSLRRLVRATLREALYGMTMTSSASASVDLLERALATQGITRVAGLLGSRDVVASMPQVPSALVSRLYDGEDDCMLGINARRVVHAALYSSVSVPLVAVGVLARLPWSVVGSSASLSASVGAKSANASSSIEIPLDADVVIVPRRCALVRNLVASPTSFSLVLRSGSSVCELSSGVDHGDGGADVRVCIPNSDECPVALIYPTKGHFEHRGCSIGSFGNDFVAPACLSAYYSALCARTEVSASHNSTLVPLFCRTTGLLTHVALNGVPALSLRQTLSSSFQMTAQANSSPASPASPPQEKPDAADESESEAV